MYPTQIVLSPVFATTIEEHLTIFNDGVTSTTESTIIAPAVTPFPTLTWTFQRASPCKRSFTLCPNSSNASRTFPTTYVAYTDFSHISVASVPTCATASVDLALGAPTDWASLIFPTAAVPAGGLLPPALVGFLDSLPEVVGELGGTIVSNCDPQQGGTLTPAAAPTATATLATSVGGVVRRTVPTTTNVPAAAAANQGLAPARRRPRRASAQRLAPRRRPRARPPRRRRPAP